MLPAAFHQYAAPHHLDCWPVLDAVDVYDSRIYRSRYLDTGTADVVSRHAPPGTLFTKPMTRPSKQACSSRPSNEAIYRSGRRCLRWISAQKDLWIHPQEFPGTVQDTMSDTMSGALLVVSVPLTRSELKQLRSASNRHGRQRRVTDLVCRLRLSWTFLLVLIAGTLKFVSAFLWHLAVQIGTTSTLH